MKFPDGKLQYIDEARGLAILMVILVHTAQMLPGLDRITRSIAGYGDMGVQLFFVASAYTLCRSFDGRSSEPLSLIAFYIRRYFRIAPLYYLGIAIYFFYYLWKHASRTDGGSVSNPYQLGNIAANLVFVHGFVPAANNTIVPGGWSIGTEMAFYAIFPLLFKFSRWVGAEHPRRIHALMLACLVIDLAAQPLFYRLVGVGIKDNNFVYFNIVNQLSVFETGIFAYFRHQTMARRVVPLSVGKSMLGFIGFTCATVALRHAAIDELFIVIPLVSAWSFYFLLNLLKARRSAIQILTAIGAVSYSMYVFHFLFVWGLVSAIFFDMRQKFPPYILLVFGYLIAVSMSFAVALVTEKYVEQRGILIGRSLINWIRSSSAKEPLILTKDR